MRRDARIITRLSYRDNEIRVFCERGDATRAETEGDGGGTPVFVSVHGVDAGGVEDEVVGAGGCGVWLYGCGPPGLKGGLVGDGVGEGRGWIGVAEGPAD